jgi:acetylornithine deacetylase
LRVDLRSAIEAGWEHQLELLRALVRSPSTLGKERDAQELIAAELADVGLSPQMWDVGEVGPGGSPPLIGYERRPNVTALRRGTGGGRSLTVNGHIDVVPIGVAHRWSFDPWGAEIADGRMYGRGAADMKAGVVAMLGALRALRDVPLRGTLCVETVIEEECTGNGAAACRARGPRTDAAIIPEPFDHTALIAQVGVLWATVTVEGKAAHAERADQADNAFLKALPVVQAIRELEREVNAGSALRLNYNVGVVRAGDWASSVPEECVLEVRLAAKPGEDLEAVKARFEQAVKRGAPGGGSPVDLRVEWRGFHAHGFELSRDEPIFDVLGRAHTSVHGAPLEFLAFTGTTDARAFVVHDETPATCYGPIGGNLHAPDEWVDLQSVKDTTLVLAQAAAEWCT